MRNPANEKLITDFFEALKGPTIEDTIAAYKHYFHPQGVWKNTGFPDLHGHDQIVHLLQEQKKLFDFACVKVLEHRLLTSVDEHVFFERRDSIVDSKGIVVYAFDILGKFTIKDGQVVEWADYMDTAQFKADWAKQDQKSLESLAKV